VITYEGTEPPPDLPVGAIFLDTNDIPQPDTGGGATNLDGLTDVTAPSSTPAGKILGTTATGAWGPVDPPAGIGAALSIVATGLWKYNGAGTPTASGEMRLAAAGTTMRLVCLDSSGNDWTVLFGAVRNGDVVTVVQDGNIGRFTITADPSFGGSGPSRYLMLSTGTWAGSAVSSLVVGKTSHISIEVPMSLYPDGSSPLVSQVHADAQYLGTDAGWHKWTGTQAQYDAISAKDPGTLYVITG
jgi:hypothetical protein